MAAEIDLLAFRGLTGQALGVSPWMRIDQSQIDHFARCTHDEQFIHVDPVRAAGTPFASTIAHGFLTLSLLSAMSYEVMPNIVGARMSLNYGFNAVRFISPVKVDSRIRGRFTLKNVSERKPGNWLATTSVSVEIENSNSPALNAEWLTLTVMANVQTETESC